MKIPFYPSIVSLIIYSFSTKSICISILTRILIDALNHVLFVLLFFIQHSFGRTLPIFLITTEINPTSTPIYFNIILRFVESHPHPFDNSEISPRKCNTD